MNFVCSKYIKKNYKIYYSKLHKEIFNNFLQKYGKLS